MSQHSLKYVDRPDLVLTESIKKRYHRSDYVPLDKPKLADKTSTGAMARKANQKDLKQREIDSLIAVGSTTVLSILAGNPVLGENDLRRLAKDSEFSVRYNVLLNPKCPLDIIIKMTSDVSKRVSDTAKDIMKDKDVLGDLLGESAKYDPFNGLSIDEMAELAKVETDPDNIIKMYDAAVDSKIDEAIASNKNTPSDIQKSLAGQVNYLVTLALSNNPGLTEVAALRLVERNAFDPRTLVIAKNALRAVSLEKVMAMTSAENPLIAEIAREELRNNRDVLGDLLNESTENLRPIIEYAHEITDPDELDRALITYSKFGSIRAVIARNVNTSGSTLSELCDDELLVVKLGALRNKSTPIEVLIKSLDDEDMNVAQIAKEELKNRDVLGDLLGESRVLTFAQLYP